MHYRKPVVILVGAAFVAYQAGEHLRYLEPSTGQIVGIATVASTASTNIGLAMSPTTFAKVEPPPPIVPPNQKFEQS
jgi:hypothetical protein